MCTRKQLDNILVRIIDTSRLTFGPHLRKIIMYGSYARGDYTPESDIDIMIILNCSKEEIRPYRKEATKLSSRLCLETDIEISMVVKDQHSFIEGQTYLPFYKNIQKEGIALYG